MATATVSFSKRKGVATKRGWYYTRVAIKTFYSIEQHRLYGTYVSDVTGDLYQVAGTCFQTWMALSTSS